jgi:hypothetical protein
MNNWGNEIGTPNNLSSHMGKCSHVPHFLSHALEVIQDFRCGTVVNGPDILAGWKVREAVWARPGARMPHSAWNTTHTYPFIQLTLVMDFLSLALMKVP